MKEGNDQQNKVISNSTSSIEITTGLTQASMLADGNVQNCGQVNAQIGGENMSHLPNKLSKPDESGQAKTNAVKRTISSSSLDLSRLRMTQNFGAQAGVKKKVITVPVRKPNRQDFVRVHPDDDYAFQTAILELKDDSEIFIVDPSLWSHLEGEIVPKILLTTINRQGVLTLWPIKLPDPDGRIDNWNHTAMLAASMGKKEWVRVAANRSLGAYEVFSATGDLPEPEWPELNLQEIMDIAFRDKLITDLDHPAVKRLMGQI